MGPNKNTKKTKKEIKEIKTQKKKMARKGFFQSPPMFARCAHSAAIFIQRTNGRQTKK